MLPDTLLTLAFQFKQTKLWETLYDSELFAVRHRDGSTSYCCVMGMMGEHLAIAVYPGEAGLASFRLLGKDRTDMDYFEVHETAMSQNCLMLSFENKADLQSREINEVRAYCKAHGVSLRGKRSYPQFQRFRPHYFPWYLDDPDDQAHMAEALEAAIAVAERLQKSTPEALGFSGGLPYKRSIPLLEKKDNVFMWSETALPRSPVTRYTSPDIKDEFSLMKLTKAKPSGKTWACDIFMHVNPAADNDDNGEPKSAPFFPYILLIVDNETSLILGLHLSDNPEDYSDAFIQAILATVQEQGLPSHILVANKRAQAFFSKLAKRMGAELEMKQEIPLLEEAKEDFIGQFAGEDDDDTTPEQVMELLRTPGMLNEMPEEMLLQLAQVAAMGQLPEDIAENVLQVCKKRGLK